MDDSGCVFIIDDDEAVLRALERLLRSHGFTVHSFNSPEAFLDRPRDATPACLLLDLRLPGMDGLEVQHVILERHADIPIVFLSGASDVRQSVRAMRQGAVDFLLKPVDEADLLAAVSRAIAEDRRRLQRRQGEAAARERLERLTARERQVCTLVARGLLNKEIASELGMAEKTVKVHRGRVMRKLEVDSVAALVRLLDLVEVPPPALTSRRDRDYTA